MRPRAVIVGKVVLQHASEVPLAEDHHMIEVFPANRSDPPLGITVLPRTPGCRYDFFDPPGMDAIAKLVTIDRVTITDQIMLGITFGKGFHDLLTRSFCRRMFRDAKVKDLSTLGFDHKEHEQPTQSNRGYSEEVNRDDLANMILHKGLPGLRRWSLNGPQDARYRPFRNRDSELFATPWSEQIEGTNGIGTCITDQGATMVHRGQHFRTRLPT
jgi:hypothetical protein